MLLAPDLSRWVTCPHLWGAVEPSRAPRPLFVAGATQTPTHWNIPIGVPTTAEIQGVTTAEVGSPQPATITVIVEGSVFGNTILVGTQLGSTSNYSFTYTPPSLATGSTFDACETTIVAYVQSQAAACGLRFIDALGAPISCKVEVEPSTWGSVKTRFQ